VEDSGPVSPGFPRGQHGGYGSAAAASLTGAPGYGTGQSLRVKGSDMFDENPVQGARFRITVKMGEIRTGQEERAFSVPKHLDEGLGQTAAVLHTLLPHEKGHNLEILQHGLKKGNLYFQTMLTGMGLGNPPDVFVRLNEFFS
jgi:hypothetical protein